MEVNLPQRELKLTESDFLLLNNVARYDFECFSDPICGILSRPENEGRKVSPGTFFPNTTESPFIAAAQHGNVQLLKHFLTNYADTIDVNRTGICTFIEQDSRTSFPIVLHDCTALNAACYGDNLKIEVVELLVSHGASVNFPNCWMNTPLMGAAKAGNVEVMEYLINKGAKVDDADMKGQTALCRATIMGQCKAIMLLLKKGADIDYRTITKQSSVHLAAIYGRLKALRLLLECGASPCFCEVDCSKVDYAPSPILLAALEGQREVVDELLSHPLCTLELRIDTLLLLGCAVFITSKASDSASETQRLWRMALTLRETSTTTTNFLPPAEVYNNRVEVHTSADLDDIMDTSTEILYQVLIIHDRCMGQIELGLARTASPLITALCHQRHYVEAVVLWTWRIEKVRKCDSLFPPEVICYHYTHFLFHSRERYFEANRSFFKSLIQSTNGEHPNMKPFIKFVLHCLECVEVSPLSPSCKKPDIKKMVYLLLSYFHLWCYKQEEKRKANRDVVDDMKQFDQDCESLGRQFVSKYGHSSKHNTLLLHSAIKAKLFEIVEPLLQWGADEQVNTPNSAGVRPLHMAIRSRHRSLETITLLLDYGAHLDAVDINGQTVVDLSVHLEMEYVRNVLVRSIYPLPLSCRACRIIVRKGIPYEQLDLPPHVKKLIRMHDKRTLQH